MTIQSAPANIAFIDLQAQRQRLGDRIDQAVMGAVNAGQWIMGPQVREFEAKLAAFSNAPYALSNANGTEALVLPLMAWGLTPRHAVFVPSFTFCATAEVVPWMGATPIFVDVLPDTYNMDPVHLEAAIKMVLAEGKLIPKVIIGVCLFGQAANYPALREIADTYGLKLIADSAQGFGTTINGEHPIKWADAVTTSFFPAKPLGCYGDGGATLVTDKELFDIMDSLRVHGKAIASDLEGRTFDHDPKYLNMRIGMNSRLDTIQAAILLEKLSIFQEEIDLRNKVAARYNSRLSNVAVVPHVSDGVVSTWAQYTLQVENRDELVKFLKEKGVPTAVYYPIPLHKQTAYEKFPVGPGGLPVTEALAEKVMSLPMHPYLDEETQDYIIGAIHSFYGAA
ncbi:DegT/DnrJ/EryC1/StrS family aminotransferase [Aquidulcibacter sp.]|jgi:UDP-2-acetamido-2-deoxy-ribo-hexuluronate aminotransferase|uniref:DegT/DnrJ/EryC1/StrS family aminotransferase n=1 Tax=Aquidulcibacter sp. TaxID=2052990 RepID=UPI003BA440FE